MAVEAISCADRCIRSEGGARAARQAAAIHKHRRKKETKKTKASASALATGKRTYAGDGAVG
jgi:hypothetical protein